jgi:von Willebrand factor type A domain
VVAVVAWVALGGVAAADVSVVATLVSADGGQARALVDVTPVPAGALPNGAITVTAGSAPLPVTATPLLADSLALGLVLDASAAGAPALAQGLSGAANLVLQLPAAAAVGVVTDASPPALLAPPSPGPTATLKALDGLRPAGNRQTQAALSMAARLLPDTPGPRVLVLYTGAADAGGIPAGDLSAALVAANVVLAVVSTSTDPAYWSKVATATGGAVVPTNPANAISAFSTVAELLRTRYQLTFTLPQPAPRSVTISVDAGTGPQTAQASVAAATAARPAAPRTDSNAGTLRWAILIAVLVAVAANIVWLLVRAARRRRRSPAVSAVSAGSATAPVRSAAAEAAPGPAARGPAARGPAAQEDSQERWGDRIGAALAANPIPVFNGPEDDAQLDEPNVRVIRAEPAQPATPAAEPAAAPVAEAPAGGPAAGPRAAGPRPGGPDAAGVIVDATPTMPIRINQIMSGLPTGRLAGEALPDEHSAGGTGAEVAAEPPAGADDVEAQAGPPADQLDAEAGAAGRAAGPGAAGGPAADAGRAAGVNGTVVAVPADAKTYMMLDATVAEAAAAVEAGRVDAAHAVARIALAAAGRGDLIDRRVTAEERLARSSQAIWPPPARVLALLREARSVTAGEVVLAGPDGVLVRQDGATLRLTRQGEWVCDATSVAELADHVDVDDLAVSERVEPPASSSTSD